MKFKINKVGRISEAQIELKKFTMLLGKNDSGKTYAASTIWAIIEFIKNIPENKEINLPQEISNFLSSLRNGDVDGKNFKYTVTPEQLNQIKESALNYLQNNLKKTLENSIGYDGFGASRVTVEFNHLSEIYFHCYFVKNKSTDIEDVTVDGNDVERFSSDEEIDELIYEDSWDADFSLSDSHGESLTRFRAHDFTKLDISNFLYNDIRQELIGYSVFGKDWSSLRNTIYIPAARTGIMLALSYFVQGAVLRTARTLKENEVSVDLPAPIRSFASQLFRMPFFGHIRRDNLLSGIIKGRFGKGKARGAYMYQPEGLQADIPLASTSSLVTELAALSLLGPRLGRQAFLIFEEPEAHLHLEAQREMARILVRLVNQGVKILITTHSDTFIQQINNLISLSGHPLKQQLLPEFGLSEDQVVNKSDVAAYEFVCHEELTVINSLDVTDAGVAAESLNSVLRKLAEETIRISSLWPDDSE